MYKIFIFVCCALCFFNNNLAAFRASVSNTSQADNINWAYHVRFNGISKKLKWSAPENETSNENLCFFVQYKINDTLWKDLPCGDGHISHSVRSVRIGSCEGYSSDLTYGVTTCLCLKDEIEGYKCPPASEAMTVLLWIDIFVYSLFGIPCILLLFVLTPYLIWSNCKYCKTKDDEDASLDDSSSVPGIADSAVSEQGQDVRDTVSDLNNPSISNDGVPLEGYDTRTSFSYLSTDGAIESLETRLQADNSDLGEDIMEPIHAGQGEEAAPPAYEDLPPPEYSAAVTLEHLSEEMPELSINL